MAKSASVAWTIASARALAAETLKLVKGVTQYAEVLIMLSSIFASPQKMVFFVAGRAKHDRFCS